MSIGVSYCKHRQCAALTDHTASVSALAHNRRNKPTVSGTARVIYRAAPPARAPSAGLIPCPLQP